MGAHLLEHEPLGVTKVPNDSLPSGPRRRFRGHTRHTTTSHTAEEYADRAPRNPPRSVGLIACRPCSFKTIPFRDQLGARLFAIDFAYFLAHVKGDAGGDSPTPGADRPKRRRGFDARDSLTDTSRANANAPTTLPITESYLRGPND